jgi:hypothetical protein
MPTIQISQAQYDRLMAFKPVVEGVLQQEMSESDFADFIVFCAMERLFLESAMSADLQLVQRIYEGDSVAKAAIDTLRAAQLTLQTLSRLYPREVFAVIAGVWKNMSPDEQRAKGIGFHVLRDDYRQMEEERHERPEAGPNNSSR